MDEIARRPLETAKCPTCHRGIDQVEVLANDKVQVMVGNIEIRAEGQGPGTFIIPSDCKIRLDGMPLENICDRAELSIVPDEPVRLRLSLKAR